jgi:hypothetical protein
MTKVDTRAEVRTGRDDTGTATAVAERPRKPMHPFLLNFLPQDPEEVAALQAEVKALA